MPEIRRLRADEMEQSSKIMTIAFNGRHDYSKPEEKGDTPPAWTWGAFGDDGDLGAVLVEHRFDMRFDGHTLPLTGIGGVATLPEARKGGLVRKIFEKMLPESYERGDVFSNLAPFSHAFYRKFGYELANCHNEVSMPTAEFMRYRMQGKFTPVFPGDDTAALQAIHSAYIANLNHGIVRADTAGGHSWRAFTKADPYADGDFLYLWSDGAQPRAYIRYSHQSVGGEDHMLVRELAFMDKEALYGALSLVGTLASQYTTLKWGMPTFLDPADFLPMSTWEIKQSIVPRDMTRVINVHKALEHMRRPVGEGEAVLEIVDAQIAANQRRYLISFGAGEMRVTQTDRAPDLIADIPSISQLITGFHTFEQSMATRREGLELRGKRAALDALFTLRPQHLTEMF